MATVSLYDASIGVATNSLLTLLDLVKAAQAHEDASSIAALRLAPDMLPFSFQIQTVSNTSKKMVERLTGKELDVWPDDETTLEQLVARLEKTIDLLKTVKKEELDAQWDAVKTVSLKIGPFDPVPATASQYVLGFALPNIMFHVSTAYAILRVKGLPLGKAVYLKNYVGDFFKPPAPAQ
ncbi:hypothetical protein C8A05DRAFT_15441 [Staphylotrichum tortipilum]|uniref:DUF1993 domain-containing protein n=1 Tax=Staphylotrichum tortipilum TaxID=2831512 RepID=A0AAN6MKF3_9PEZI|nr:hypothetical protein C8A05DRAFT_15441 [Staphylotrichum longicolle]